MSAPLILTVSSGVGPIEVRRFVRRLADALADEVRARGLSIEASVGHGSEQEPRSVDLLIRGTHASLADLVGSHALVLRSEGRGKRDRKRWYAGVSVEERWAADALTLELRDVRFETCRASGAGGQHVNKTETAVRALHEPSGLTVRVQSERSQLQNKRRALRALTRMLAVRGAAKRADAKRTRRRRSLHVERGAPVATWRLDGDTLVRAERKRDANAT